MDRLWWNHITKAHKFIEDLASAAVEGKSILLSLPQQVPWRETLLELLSRVAKNVDAALTAAEGGTP